MIVMAGFVRGNKGSGRFSTPHVCCPWCNRASGIQPPKIQKGVGTLIKSEKGFSLIEVIIAIALLGIIGVTFLSGLAVAFKSVIIMQERVTAESLAKSQLEYIKNQDYRDEHHQYQKIDIPSELADQGYDIEWPFERETLGDGLQKITVVVSHRDKKILEVEGYKLDR